MDQSVTITAPLPRSVGVPTGEAWVKVPDFNYAVSTLGRVKNIVTDRVLRSGKGGWFTLCRNGQTFNYKVGQTPRLAFVPSSKRPEGDWTTIPEFPAYAVSSDGRVLRIKTGRVLRSNKKEGEGRGHVSLMRNGKVHHQSIPQLIAKTTGVPVKPTTTHRLCVGGKTAPEVTAYHSARRRCTNPADEYYFDYGGRGIEFRFTSVTEFIDALRTPDNPTGRRPAGVNSKGITLWTLDRIDNDGHYEKGNVRWATWDVQNGNRFRQQGCQPPAHPVTQCGHPVASSV